MLTSMHYNAFFIICIVSLIYNFFDFFFFLNYNALDDIKKEKENIN